MVLYNTAQYLDAQFSEEYIVDMIIQHFDEGMEEVMTLYNFKSMDTLCQFLISQERTGTLKWTYAAQIVRLQDVTYRGIRTPYIYKNHMDRMK